MAKGQAKGLAIGEAKGLVIGEAKGLAKGTQQEKIAIARKMLKRGLDLQMISEDTGLDVEEIEKLYE